MIVRVGIPTLSSEIHIECMKSIMKLEKILKQHKIKMVLDFEVGSLITRCRQNILKRFYKYKNDYLLFIDADISNFENHIVDLITKVQKYKTAIIGINYRKKKYDLVARDYTHNNVFNGNLLNNVLNTIYTSKEEVIKVKHIPTGCMLIPRKIIEKLLLCDNRGTHFNYFDCYVDVDNKYLSEDYAFCNRVRELLTGDILCYYSPNLKHHLGNIYFDGTYKNYLINLNKNI